MCFAGLGIVAFGESVDASVGAGAAAAYFGVVFAALRAIIAAASVCVGDA